MDSTVCLPARGLPLTAFEEHMLLDDRPTHPMVILARFDFRDGRPPAALDAAFRATLASEPLLAARVRPGRCGRPRWVAAAPPRLVHVGGDGSGVESAPAAPDPWSGPTLHAESREHGAGWSLRLAVHHAACDGLGLVGFVERWLTAACTGAVIDRPPERTRRALAARGRVATSWRRFLGLTPQLAVGLGGVGKFMGREVAALGSGAAQRAAGPWRPCVVSDTLPADVVRCLDRAALAWRVNVNDLIVGVLVGVLAPHVPAGRGRDGGRPWIRIAVPLSLRTAADAALPAANRVSMVFLDRRPEAADMRALAVGLRAEMDLIRDCGLGHIFPLALAAGRLLPGGLARVTRRPRPQSTAVLSNLGRCFRRSPLGTDAELGGGAGRLSGWWIVPPVRPGTALAVATHETADRRTVTFHVDPTRIPEETATAWLAEVLARLRTLAVQHDPTDAPGPEALFA